MSKTDSKTEKQFIAIEYPFKDIKQLGEKADCIPNYDTKSNSLQYEIVKTVPKDFYDKLKELVPKFEEDDIITFNPLVNATLQLQQHKLYIETEDFAASERTYIDSNKMIGSFNTAIKNAKSILKEPQISKNKMIDAIFDLFSKESDNTREALKNNFKKTLQKKEDEAKAKEAKKNAEATARIAELSEQATQAEQIIREQKIDNRFLVLKNNISNISVDLISKIPSLNISGLEEEKAKLNSMKFEHGFTQEDRELLGPDKENELRQLFVINHMKAVEVVLGAISNIQNQEKVKDLASENAVLKASTPVFTPEEENNDLPFALIPEIEVQAEVVGQVTDLMRFNIIKEISDRIQSEYENKISVMTEMRFEDPGLEKIRTTLIEQDAKMIEWLGKITAYTTKQHTNYLNHLNTK
jgi:hypothetical protein